MEEESFLLEKFREYYFQNTISEPPSIEKREFGIGGFGKKISQRHLAFLGFQELNDFLKEKAPFFVSYSAAYYESPGARPMEAKQWQGGDLVFEFDADDLKTDCKMLHDSWECPNCGSNGKGNPGACTNCGSSVKVDEWVCPDCLKAIKKQVIILVDLLERELGFSSGLSLNFSGSKGFHIHVRSKEAKKLSPQARIEILDFLTGHELDLERLGFSEKNKSLYGVPFSLAKGWQKRILTGLFELLYSNDSGALAVAGNISVRSANKILEKKESIIQGVKKGFFPGNVTGKPRKFWSSVLDFVSDDLKLDIDRQTSLDKYKVLRLPETLHGGTGLKAGNLSFSGLDTFDALTECVVFGEKPVELELAKAIPRFFLKNEWFGPFEPQTIKLPEFAAVFLIARGSARFPASKKR